MNNKGETMGLRAWWQDISAGRSFEFKSPYSVDVCIQILEERSERGKGNGWAKNSLPKLLIQMNDNDKNTREFYMHRDAGRNLHTEVIGMLVSHGDSTTVRGLGKVGKSTITFSIIFVGIWALALGIITIPLVLWLGIEAILLIFAIFIPAIVIFILLYISVKARNDMIKLLHEILGG